MVGVFTLDDLGTSITEFLFRNAYENAFVVDASRRVSFEVGSFGWRRMLARGGSDEAPLAGLRAQYVAALQSGGDDRSLGFHRPLSHWIAPQFESGDPASRLIGTQVVPVTRSGAQAVGLVMAGGFGRRLGDLTRDVPKPMLDLGGRPICAHLVENFLQSGISDLYLSVFYLKHVVRQYFGSGAHLGASIAYLEESRPLGTAGCLSLLPPDLDRPVVMVNGDVVTDVSFARLLEYHERSGFDVTVSVRPHHVHIPFGVVEQREGQLLRVREKPRYEYPINVAIYVLSPRVLRELRFGEQIDMPTFIDRLLSLGYTAGIFPLLEKWIDVGTVVDLQRARAEYQVPALTAAPYLRLAGAAACEPMQASA